MDETELLRQELALERRARRQAEELLEQKSLELFQRGEELRLKAEALAHSNAELEQFAYVASHDLQAPLRTMAGFSQLLAKRARHKLDGEELEYLDYMDSGAKKLQRLISDLLGFSRVGRTAYVMGMHSAQQLMDDLRDQLRNELEQRQAELVYAALPEVYADRVHLGRVLQNLVDNALKFQPSGRPPRIEVSAQRQGSGWQLSVRDNGIGIEAEYLGKIFGVFTRLHNDDDYPGTGVGLAVCKKIIERHGGRLWVESVPGTGTSFHFTLPGPASGRV